MSHSQDLKCIDEGYTKLQITIAQNKSRVTVFKFIQLSLAMENLAFDFLVGWDVSLKF